MTPSPTPVDDSLALLERIDGICVQFEEDWRAGAPPQIEDLLDDVQEQERSQLLLELLQIEFNYRTELEPALSLDEYRERFPDDIETVVDAIERFSVTNTRTPDEAAGHTSLHRIRYLGKYELLEEIARGGMGIVFKARQTTLGRTVAVKIMRSGQLADDEQIARFEREAKLAARLQHPHIVAVHEVGRHGGLPYFSMDHVDGRSLKETVRDSPLRPRDAARYLLVTAETVQRAHEEGILHRDIKPSNVLIDREDRVRITDFGLAKVLGAGETLTESEGVMGTPGYMPPEQAVGNRAMIGTHSDVYSLGATLYELLTGRPPFAAATVVETLHQVKHREPIPPRMINPAIPRDLETICLKCLRKEPTRRYATADELAADLRRWMDGEPIRARPVSRVEKTWLWCRRRPAIAGSAAAILLTACLVTGFTLGERERNLTQRVETTVSSLNSTRGVIRPPLNYLEGFPREMVLSELQSQFESADGTRKLPLAYALAHYDDVRVPFLLSEVDGASPDEFDNLVAALGHSGSDGLVALEAAARTAADEQDWRHGARVSMLALHLNLPALAGEICDTRPDPVPQSWFIAECSTWHGDLSKLAQLTDVSDAGPVRSTLALAAGSAADATPADRQAWESMLSRWYRNEPDALTHSAAGWALRKFNLELPPIPPSPEPVGGHNWCVNSAGMTMLLVPAGRFVRREDRAGAIDQAVTLTRSFLLADSEVTREQFQRFIEDPACPNEEKPRAWGGADIGWSPTGQHPVQQVSWYDAVQFCNWLSLQEGLDPCYQRTGELEVFRDAWELDPQARGYRLPTEAEWEYACRAESRTRYCFGDDESLLDRYAVYLKSRTEPPGSGLPNRWGLFDMHGNVWEWCHDWSGPLGSDATSNVSDPLGPDTGITRVLRGGSFYSHDPREARSAYRHDASPGARLFSYGFRVARTFPATRVNTQDRTGRGL